MTQPGIGGVRPFGFPARCRASVVLGLLLGPIAAAWSADLVIHNGRILTMQEEQPIRSAIAVKDGRIVYVGDGRDIAAHRTPETVMLDLQGGFAMPALHDAHVHPVRGGLKSLYECNFPFSATPAQVADAVSRCVAEQPDALWIRGGQWDSGFFDRFSVASPRRFLDAVSADKAVFLNDDSNHNGWLNSRALELLGIDRHTPDPDDGQILRDAEGVPTGVLLEGAEQAAADKLPDWTAEQFLQAARRAQALANSHGIVGLKDANALPEYVVAYHRLAIAGELNAYVAASLQTPYGARDQDLDFDALDAQRRRYRAGLLSTEHVKLFLDGVPTPSRTAAMLEDYLPEPRTEHTHNGKLHLSPERLQKDLRELDARGYTVKLHAAGDRSVREALNAVAAARQANPDSTLRHEIAHAGYIDPEDIPRFRQLGAVADLSPYLWHPSSIIDAVISAVGPQRGPKYWPIRSLLEAQAPVLAGSDWPAAVESINPWPGIEAMVTRAHPAQARDDYLWREQGIPLSQALGIMTRDGARANGVSHRSGVIRTGMSADIIVLDRDLLRIDPREIGETRVLKTLFRGKLVYEESASPTRLEATQPE